MLELVNPRWLAAKATLAVALALAGAALLGNPDRVSATFVAVICTTPTVLAGLRRALAQVIGSAIGGGLAALAAALGLPLELGLPLAVGLSVWLSFRTGQGAGYAVAAFTAIYVLVIPRGDAVHTLEIRLLAVAIGAVSAVVVSSVVSSLAYGSIFRKRLARTLAATSGALERAAAQGPDQLLPLFPLLAAYQAEVEEALRELRWRRSSRTLARVDAAAKVAQALARVAHLARDLGLAEEELPAGERVAPALLRHSAARVLGTAKEEPGPGAAAGARLLAGLRRLDVAIAALEATSPVAPSTAPES